jgi:hypothetical protein
MTTEAARKTPRPISSKPDGSEAPFGDIPPTVYRTRGAEACLAFPHLVGARLASP